MKTPSSLLSDWVRVWFTAILCSRRSLASFVFVTTGKNLCSSSLTSEWPSRVFHALGAIVFTQSLTTNRMTIECVSCSWCHRFHSISHYLQNDHQVCFMLFVPSFSLNLSLPTEWPSRVFHALGAIVFTQSLTTYRMTIKCVSCSLCHRFHSISHYQQNDHRVCFMLLVPSFSLNLSLPTEWPSSVFHALGAIVFTQSLATNRMTIECVSCSWCHRFHSISHYQQNDHQVCFVLLVPSFSLNLSLPTEWPSSVFHALGAIVFTQSLTTNRMTIECVSCPWCHRFHSISHYQQNDHQVCFMLLAPSFSLNLSLPMDTLFNAHVLNKQCYVPGRKHVPNK